MRVSLSWLKDFLHTTASVDDLAAAFVRLGHEVEEVSTAGGVPAGVLVGKVQACKPHPDADRLRVCQVDLGSGDLQQIVCGAPNVREGLTVAVATPGATLPGDFTIKKSKIRGETSNGMICSVKELGLGTDADGIWELDTPAAPGTPVADIVAEGDTVFDLSITPNRGDALSIIGLARDLAAGGMGQFTDAWLTGFNDHSKHHHGDAHFTPQLNTPGCRYFCGVSVRGINAAAPSPKWLTSRLEAAGLRTINAPVDVGNYVMLTLGQPLHCYDAAKIQGHIAATEATGGEILAGLDGLDHTLNKGELVIVDKTGVLGLAGIVGGIASSVTTATTEVFVEGAQFDRSCIARAGQAHQIFTDARHRFERGIDPSKTLQATLLAAYLIADICGGKVSHPAHTGELLPKPVTLDFDPAIVLSFGGVDLPASRTKTLLEALGYAVADSKAGTFKLTVPPHLTATTTPEDVVEDVLRLNGYEAIPALLPGANLNPLPEVDGGRKLVRFARRHFAARGYLEALNYSFISAKAAKAFGGGAAMMAVTNPIDADTMSTMRPSLLPGLLLAAQKNVARGEEAVALAEAGSIFLPQADPRWQTEHTEQATAAGVRLGASPARHWVTADRQPDVFTAKGDALSLLDALGHDLNRVMVKAEAPAWYHPGRSGTLIVQGRPAATFGELHPQVLKKLGLKGRAVGFELNLDLLAQLKVTVAPFAMSAYQPVRRDFAFVVEDDQPAGDLLTTVRKAGKELVRDVTLFDVYAGDKLPAGKKSLAISVTLQAADRTLTEADITAVSSAIVSAAEKRHGAALRA